MPDKKKHITVDDLWKFERIGGLSLAPDGAQAVCAVSSFSMADNKSVASLWLLWREFELRLTSMEPA